MRNTSPMCPFSGATMGVSSYWIPICLVVFNVMGEVITRYEWGALRGVLIVWDSLAMRPSYWISLTLNPLVAPGAKTHQPSIWNRQRMKSH